MDDPAAGERGAVRAEAAADRETRPAAAQGDRIGTPAQIAAALAWEDAVIHVYGKDEKAQIASCDALWYGSFKSAPGQLVLVRDPASRKPYDLGLFSLDTTAAPAGIAERYSWRWAIEPSNATGKQLIGVGDACNRTQKAVERTVPFGFLVQSLMIVWYAIACDPAADIERRRRRNPWYRTKATPSPADMHAALRGELTAARTNSISPGQNDPAQFSADTLTSEAAAA